MPIIRRAAEPAAFVPPGFDAFPQIWAQDHPSAFKTWIANCKARRSAKLAEVSTILHDMKSPFVLTSSGKVGVLGYVMARG
jgi:hypothetical protein